MKRPTFTRTSEAEITLLREAKRRRALAREGTPVDLMLQMMRDQYAAGNLDAAASLARDLAPFVHSRLASLKPEVPQEDLDVQALALHRLLREMDQTVGSDVEMDISPPPRSASGVLPEPAPVQRPARGAPQRQN